MTELGARSTLTTDALEEVALRCGRPMRLICARWSKIITDEKLMAATDIARAAMSALAQRDAWSLTEIVTMAAGCRLFRLARWILAMSVELHRDMKMLGRLGTIQDAAVARPCIGAAMLMADMFEHGMWWYPEYRPFMIADDDTARRIIAACPALASRQANISARRRDLIMRLVAPVSNVDMNKLADSPDSESGMKLRARLRRESGASWLITLARMVDLDGEYVPLSECSLLNPTTCCVIGALSAMVYLAFKLLR